MGQICNCNHFLLFPTHSFTNFKQVKCHNFDDQGGNQEWKIEGRLQIAKLKIDSEQLKLFTCKKTESENEWSESDEIPDIYSGSE